MNRRISGALRPPAIHQHHLHIVTQRLGQSSVTSLLNRTVFSAPAIHQRAVSAYPALPRSVNPSRSLFRFSPLLLRKVVIFLSGAITCTLRVPDLLPSPQQPVSCSAVIAISPPGADNWPLRAGVSARTTSLAGHFRPHGHPLPGFAHRLLRQLLHRSACIGQMNERR